MRCWAGTRRRQRVSCDRRIPRLCTVTLHSILIRAKQLGEGYEREKKTATLARRAIKNSKLMPDAGRPLEPNAGVKSRGLAPALASGTLLQKTPGRRRLRRHPSAPLPALPPSNLGVIGASEGCAGGAEGARSADGVDLRRRLGAARRASSRLSGHVRRAWQARAQGRRDRR